MFVAIRWKEDIARRKERKITPLSDPEKLKKRVKI